MKYVITVLLISSLSFSNILFSQKKFNGGFYLGTSLTTMSGVDFIAEALTDALSQAAGKDFPVTKSPRSLLFNAGGFINYNFSPVVALKAGIEYAPKGEKFNGECYLSTDPYTMTSEVLVLDAKIDMAYLEFPISVQFSVKSKDNSDKAYCYFNVGISPAVKILSDVEVSSKMVERGFDKSGVVENPIGESQYDSKQLDGIKGSDFGAFCSAGVTGGKFFRKWFMDLKFEHGLQNILENPVEEDVKNNMVALSIGYKF